ncbi:GMC family oxidoreductase N-terminal domain-containing protein [Streptomyces sp. LN325]|uniref:GMC family oxidoreductase N-terminal domain-containing protein n=1 Tax=Streptomyces sp. LN325 TaxID=3112976 RepID=UPI00371B6D77
MGATGYRIPAPRAKVLGGSSTVNAAVALRARAADFATWTARGIGNWSFEEVLKTYRLLENSDAGSDLLHGRTGPFPIRQQTFEELTPSLRAFVEAAASQGFARIADPNGDRQNGVAAYPFNIVSGVRRNTAFVYLSDEVRSRPNLTVVGLAEVDAVEFSGTTATAVRTVDGTIHEGGEIICRPAPTAAQPFSCVPASAYPGTWSAMESRWSPTARWDCASRTTRSTTASTPSGPTRPA